MRTRISLLVILVVLAALFVGSCRRAGTWLVKEDALVENDAQVRIDAMVMLMGSPPDRVLQVDDLYDRAVAERVIIVEEGMGAFQALEERGAHIISNSRQVRNALVTLGIPEESIVVLAGDATSTQMEAVIVRDYLDTRPGIGSLLLVSSAAHMRRASMIFKAAVKPLDHPVRIYCSPSAYSSFEAGKWWKTKEGIQHVLMEYLKIGNFIFFERRQLNRQ